MELHDYQKHAVRFALHAFTGPAHGCGLFLEPGLGKTAISIAVMDIWKRLHPDARFLVIAPTLVARHSWPDELDAWKDTHHLSWALCWGTPKKRLAALDEQADVTIINQENLAWLDEVRKDWPYRGIVVDEIVGFKNTNSTRTRVLARRRGHVDWCLGLTGTPASRELDDMFGIVRAIDDGYAWGSSITRFRERWMRPDRYMPDGRGGRRVLSWTPLPGARWMLAKRIESYCMSMRAKDKLPGLPAMLEHDIWLDMPETTRLLYDKLRKDMAATVNGVTITVANAGVLTAKLAQLTCGCLYPDPDDPRHPDIRHVDDVKLDMLATIREQADGPLLVFYQFTDELERMRHRFPDLREVHEHGVLDEWRAGRVPMLAAHPAAAKYGLNIQDGGHEIVWTSLPWSFDDYRQACDRLHRQGQSHPVTVHRLLESDTVDERRLNVLKGRESLHEAVMGALTD